MAEVAIGIFGLSLSEARDLTLVEYRLLEAAQLRKVRSQHERDTWMAWMTAEFHRYPTPYRRMLRIATGQGAKDRAADPDGGLRMQRHLQVMAEFEAWFQETQRASGMPENDNGGE